MFYPQNQIVTHFALMKEKEWMEGKHLLLNLVQTSSHLGRTLLWLMKIFYCFHQQKLSNQPHHPGILSVFCPIHLPEHTVIIYSKKYFFFLLEKLYSIKYKVEETSLLNQGSTLFSVVLILRRMTFIQVFSLSK